MGKGSVTMMPLPPPRAAFVPRACVANRHTWHPLCQCGHAAVCLRCGVGMGAIPCQCMVRRWSEGELVRKSVERGL